MFRNTIKNLFKNSFQRARSNARGAQGYSTYRTFNNQHGQVNNIHVFWNRHWKGISIGAVGVAGFVGTHLERTPISDRLRFIAVSKAYENKIGEQGYEEVLQQYHGSILPDNHPYTQRVKTIMKRLIKVSGLEQDQLDWRIHVVNDPNAAPNAFVLPSGKVFVFTSIFPIARDDDGLATVLSHETAHVLLRHSAESLSQAPFLMIADLVLSVVFNINFSGLTTLLFQLPASRTHESEADYVGLMMMAGACYNTQEAVAFWKRMGKAELKGRSGSVPELLSTHPATKHRVENMEQWLPKARAEYEKADCQQHHDSFHDFRSIFGGGRGGFGF